MKSEVIKTQTLIELIQSVVGHLVGVKGELNLAEL